ncbi:MAG: response regulator [Myxococcota bacterium]
MNEPKRVLAVEDDAVDRLTVKRGLERSQEFQVSTAEDLASAYKMVDAESFAAAVVDWNLPDGNALDFLSRLEGRAINLPVVVLTGHDDDQRARIALERGAQDYLIKGEFKPDTLVRAIRYAVERKRSEEFRNRLHHADRLVALGNLAAGICHEINNPMAWLLANMEFLREQLQRLSVDSDRNVILDCLEMIEESETGLQRIARTASALRDYARLNPDTSEDVDLNRVLEDSARIAGHDAKHRADIRLELGPSIPVIRGDAAALQQVFINLIMNATQAIDEAGVEEATIRVTTNTHGGEVLGAIDDSGPGIPESIRSEIFAPFFTTKTKSHGTGLGLPIARDIVMQFGGNLSVGDSELGGARFEVRLPAQSPGPGEVKNLSVDILPVRADLDARVLVIDDEPSILRMIKRSLRDQRVDVAETVDAGLALVGSSDYDAVLCDLNLRPRSGADFYDELAKRRPEMLKKLTFMTGGAVSPDLRRFEKSAEVQWLRKPFTRRDLMQAVRRGVTDPPSGASGHSLGEIASGSGPLSTPI